MKKILLCAIIAVFALTLNSFSASAKDIPAGMRMEIVSAEENDNVFEIFTYKDEDGTIGYYLGLGREFRILDYLDIEIPGTSFSLVDEVCLCLGATSDEAMASLESLMSIFDKDVNTVAEFPARMSTGAERLGDPTTVKCIVKKKFLRGKYLQFNFVSGKHSAEADLFKSTVKELKMGLKIDKKLHKR